MKKRAKLGDVEITVVESEKPRDSVSVTDNSVEKGQDVSDHVKQESTVMDLVGVFTGDDAAAKIQQLRKYQIEGKLLSYIGRNMYDNMVLQTFERDHNKSIANGFYYNITLKQIRLATATEVEIKVVNPVTKQASPKTATKVKAKTNNGKQQPQKKTTSPVNLAAQKQIQRLGMYQGGLQDQEKASPLANMKVIKNTYKTGNALGIYQGGLS